jgi:hypothetical protein
MNELFGLTLPATDLGALVGALCEQYSQRIASDVSAQAIVKRLLAAAANLDARPRDTAALSKALIARLDFTQDEHHALMIQLSYDVLMAAGLGDETSRFCLRHVLADGRTLA